MEIWSRNQMEDWLRNQMKDQLRDRMVNLRIMVAIHQMV